MERNWQWMMTGKHPCASDYLAIGDKFQFAHVFSKWIERGYDVVNSKKPVKKTFYQWRFWTQEARRDYMACGVIKDSCDAFGRPYPILIIGAGHLSSWEKQWDLLPFACEAIWLQMEYMLSKDIRDSLRLGEQLKSIKMPKPDWPDYLLRRQNIKGLDNEMKITMEKAISQFSDGTDLYFEIKNADINSHFDIICIYHNLLRLKQSSPPYAIFMGGSIERLYAVCYRRSLLTNDFIKLWSM